MQDIEQAFEAEKSKLSIDEQRILAQVLMGIVYGKDESANQRQLDLLPESVKSCVSLFLVMKMKQGIDREDLENKRKRDEPIRQTALEIMKTLIRANPGVKPIELLDQAIEAAQALHDRC